jgi:hypothetical protein
MARKRLGQLLLERGLIDVEQLNSALAYHRQWNVRLGSALVAKGFIAEGTLTRTLAESLQIPMVDLSKVDVDKKATGLVKRTVCEQYEIFPIAVKEHRGRHTLLLAMADPLNVAAIDEVAFTTDMTVRPAIAQISSLDAAIRKYLHNQPVEIPPLDFEKKTDADLPTVEGEQLQILSAGERVIDLEQAGDEESTADDEEDIDAGPISLDDMDVIEEQSVGGEDPLRAAEEAMRMERAAAEAAGQPAYQVAADEHDPFSGEPTGAFVMAGDEFVEVQPQVSQDVLQSVSAAEADSLESMEKKFWALMRVLARKGLITKEEFLAEFNAEENVEAAE